MAAVCITDDIQPSVAFTRIGDSPREFFAVLSWKAERSFAVGSVDLIED